MIQSHIRDFKKCQNKIISLEVVFSLKKSYCIIYIGLLIYWLSFQNIKTVISH